MTYKLRTDVYRHTHYDEHYMYVTMDPLDSSFYYCMVIKRDHPEVCYSNMHRSDDFALIRDYYTSTGIGWVPTTVNFFNDYPELFI